VEESWRNKINEISAYISLKNPCSSTLFLTSFYPYMENLTYRGRKRIRKKDMYKFSVVKGYATY
jgi:hypothetical protein